MTSFFILNFGFKKRGATVLVVPLDPYSIKSSGLKKFTKRINDSPLVWMWLAWIF